MAEVQGYLSRVKILAGVTPMVGAAAPTGAYVLGVDKHDYAELCDALEMTAEGETYKRRMGGLKDTTVSFSGNYYSGDTTGQAVLIPGNYAMVGVYPSGPSVAGKQVNVLITEYAISSDVTGKQTFKASVVANGAPVALPLIT